MHSRRPSFKFVRHSPAADGMAASSIGVVLNYDGREVRLSISLGRAINADEPEDELVMAELKRLEVALGAILA
ncbi:MAG TPA: hypothetical protein VNR39_01355 [Pseudolabrys sp.]|nr:hypothetical protein [Pseudolabrys sp.]